MTGSGCGDRVRWLNGELAAVGLEFKCAVTQMDEVRCWIEKISLLNVPAQMCDRAGKVFGVAVHLRSRTSHSSCSPPQRQGRLSFGSDGVSTLGNEDAGARVIIVKLPFAGFKDDFLLLLGIERGSEIIIYLGYLSLFILISRVSELVDDGLDIYLWIHEKIGVPSAAGLR